MGHHRTTVQGVGKDKADAESEAISLFFHEHGHRHSLRDVESSVLIKKLPPKKRVETRKRDYIEVNFVEDPSAPQEEWLEVWEFVLHTHA